MPPHAMRLAEFFFIGAFLGSLVNWAIYTLAWFPRPISPWGPRPAGTASRGWIDRMPIIGWLSLRREAPHHGPRFWLRPLLIELGTGAAVAALYWWEIEKLALVQGQTPAAIVPPIGPIYCQFASHTLLLCLMLAASFIDIDEKIVPDDITVSGTILGLILATFAPLSLLPHVAERGVAPVVGAALKNPADQLAVGPNGMPLWLEPVTAIAPNSWPPAWAEARDWRSLAVGLGCYWLWCFALAPRIWRGRRGPSFALRLILSRLNRELARPPLRWLLQWGTAAIVFVWALNFQGWNVAEQAWAGLLTALVGLAGSGGLVWSVRLIGHAALKREAMGFGDVTFMMMVGAFLGWQACLILFFLAPFAGVVVGLLQLALRRDDEIPYVPYLCLAAVAVVVGWAPIWLWGQDLFRVGWLVPTVLVICLSLLGIILAVWQAIKTALFGRVA